MPKGDRPQGAGTAQPDRLNLQALFPGLNQGPQLPPVPPVGTPGREAILQQYAAAGQDPFVQQLIGGRNVVSPAGGTAPLTPQQDANQARLHQLRLTLGSLEGFGTQGRADIMQFGQEQGAQRRQQAVSSGLGGITQGTGQDRGTQAALAQFNENLGAQRAGIFERINIQGPDPNLAARLAEGAGVTAGFNALLNPQVAQFAQFGAAPGAQNQPPGVGGPTGGGVPVPTTPAPLFTEEDIRRLLEGNV